MRQADAVDFPVTQWGTIGANRPMPGTWSFYVDDHRFGALWRDPSPVLRAGAVNVVEPNFSTHDQHPRAYVLWQVYRKRWLARWWQTKGLRVFVDLNVTEAHSISALWASPGAGAPTPRGALRAAGRSSGSTTGRPSTRGRATSSSSSTAAARRPRPSPGPRGWHWVPEQFDAAKKRTKEKKDGR